MLIAMIVSRTAMPVMVRSTCSRTGCVLYQR